MRRLASPRVSALLILVAAALGSAGAAGSTDAEGDVYRLTVTATIGPATEGWIEWLAPGSGRYRIEQSNRTYVFTGSSYAILDKRQGAHVRTGSAAFLGSFSERAAARDALRGFLAGNLAGVEVKEHPDGRKELHFRRGETKIVAIIEEKLSALEAQERKIFVIPSDEVTSSATERRVGSRPARPIRVYWFGPAVAGRVAVTAIENFAGPASGRGNTRPAQPDATVTSHTTFYERPAAKGKSSALPGQRPPAGEIQVLSQPVGSWTAQRAIKAYNGINGDLRYKPWPRTSVRLSNGEKVTVVPDRGESTGKVRSGFAVITRTTLVTVTGSGSFALNSIPGTARLLRPIL